MITADEYRPREERAEASLQELSSSADQRAARRFAAELDVSISSDHNFYAGFTENMSVGGVFVATHLLKPVGSIVEISIFLPGIERVVRGTGEVRWIRSYNESSDVPPGMGIRFVEVDQASLDAIAAFLSHREPMFFDE